MRVKINEMFVSLAFQRLKKEIKRRHFSVVRVRIWNKGGVNLRLSNF